MHWLNQTGKQRTADCNVVPTVTCEMMILAEKKKTNIVYWSIDVSRSICKCARAWGEYTKHVEMIRNAHFVQFSRLIDHSTWLRLSRATVLPVQHFMQFCPLICDHYQFRIELYQRLLLSKDVFKRQKLRFSQKSTCCCRNEHFIQQFWTTE